MVPRRQIDSQYQTKSTRILPTQKAQLTAPLQPSDRPNGLTRHLACSIPEKVFSPALCLDIASPTHEFYAVAWRLHLDRALASQATRLEIPAVGRTNSYIANDGENMLVA